MRVTITAFELHRKALPFGEACFIERATERFEPDM